MKRLFRIDDDERTQLDPDKLRVARNTLLLSRFLCNVWCEANIEQKFRRNLHNDGGLC